jgi:hypothetical protein
MVIQKSTFLHKLEQVAFFMAVVWRVLVKLAFLRVFLQEWKNLLSMQVVDMANNSINKIQFAVSSSNKSNQIALLLRHHSMAGRTRQIFNHIMKFL